MNTIDKLIEELCPDGVEYVEMGKVCAYSDSKIDGKSLNSTTFVGVDNLLPNKGGKADATYSPNTERLTKYEHGDVILGNIRPYLKKIWLADSMGGCSGDVLAIRINQGCQSTLAPEFLYYLLSSDAFFDYNTQHAKGAKMPRGNKEAIMRFPIPLPPLEIQREIVKILDTFSQLEAELEAELEARRLQYRHYRDELLSFGDEVEWRTLGEVGTFIRGNGLQKKDLIDSGVGAIHYGQLYTHYGTSAKTTISFVSEAVASKLRSAQMGDLVIATTSENEEDVCKAVAWLGSQNVAVSGDAVIYRHEMVPKYVSYFFQSNHFRQLKLSKVSGTKVKRVSIAHMSSFPIPIPPLSEQQRIVDILDKFDALVNDLSSGLPAEIAARRQQYEHYRDRLLTFTEKGGGQGITQNAE